MVTAPVKCFVDLGFPSSLAVFVLYSRYLLVFSILSIRCCFTFIRVCSLRTSRNPNMARVLAEVKRDSCYGSEKRGLLKANKPVVLLQAVEQSNTFL